MIFYIMLPTRDKYYEYNNKLELFKIILISVSNFE